MACQFKFNSFIVLKPICSFLFQVQQNRSFHLNNIKLMLTNERNIVYFDIVKLDNTHLYVNVYRINNFILKATIDIENSVEFRTTNETKT